MSLHPPLAPSKSRASLAQSVTTYHSLLNTEQSQEPVVVASPQKKSTIDGERNSCQHSMQPSPTTLNDEESLSAHKMQRQDSGYEFITPTKSQSSSRNRSSSGSPVASSSSSSCSARRSRTRPCIRRATHSQPVSHIPRSRPHSMYLTRSKTVKASSPPIDFSHFPHVAPLDLFDDAASPVIRLHTAPAGRLDPDEQQILPDVDDQASLESPACPIPPQTTHYWTSDRTRRLEYAAIDAASRGIRGWVNRHLIPDCIIPKEYRRVRFEDDRGSVVRYRLDLDTEDEKEEPASELRSRRLWKVWMWSTSR